MIIETLNLENFRNYESLNINFDEKYNIIYGDNAQGKTNILEAIYMCGTSKSHRNSKDKEVIKFGKDEAHIKLCLRKNNNPVKIDVHIKKNKSKGIAINGLPIKRVSELFGIINVICFSPEDLKIIKNGPSERRRFIDIELCQINKLYVYNLVNYNKVINQRNNLLKELSFDNNKYLYETIDVWDEQLLNYGNEIIKIRKKFIDNLNEVINDIHREITDDREKIVIKYEPSVTDKNFAYELKRNRDRDLKYKATTIGPHRDDLGFFINDTDIRYYGSQGQQRTAALTLKLSEISLVRDMIKDNPVLLLDDVMSELDRNRQEKLSSVIKNVQTIITCTGIEDFIKSSEKTSSIYKIKNGSLEL